MTNLARNRHLVEDLTSACRDYGAGLGDAPKMLRVVLETQAWRQFTTSLGEEVSHGSFASFATDKPLRGLGVEVAFIRRIAGDDAELLDLLDQALQNQHGGDRNKSDNVTLVPEPTGNSEAKALRRLRKEADAGNETAAELRAEVLAGRLSAHGAMVKAGYRPRTVSVPVGRPESVAAALRRHMTPDQLARLVVLLVAEPDQP